MSHRQKKLHDALMLSILNSEEGAPCYESYLLFFPEGEPSIVRSAEKEAKQICNGCPFKAQCLEYALTAHEPEGVWGGKTAKERELLILAKKQTRLKDQKTND